MKVSRFNPHRYPILVSLGFFLITLCIAFFYHTYWTIFDQDGLIYYQAGKEILNGNGANVQLLNAGPGGPVLFAVLDSIFHDGFFVIKLIALLSGTAIVFFSYYIIRNIFSARVALVGQLFVAFNPWFNVLSTQALIDLLPIFLSIVSLYFLTKENWKFYDMMIIGFITGLAFMVRYQSILVLFTAIIVILLSQKKFSVKMSYVTVLVMFFLILASPMFFYNYAIHGNLVDSNPDYIIASRSKYTTPEWQNQLLLNINEDTSKGLLLDFDLTVKNYFYNIFYGQPSNLFGFENRINVSLIPAIYVIGFFPVLGGFLYSLKIKLDKANTIALIVSLSITAILVIVLGKFNDHFFAIVMISLFVLLIINFKKIKKNLLPLIIFIPVYILIMGILPLRSPQHFLIIWISIATLSAIFFIETIPVMYKKIINKSNSRISSSVFSIEKFSIVLVILILLVNVGYSYLLYSVITSGDNPTFSKNNLFDYHNKKIRYDAEIQDITRILKKQPNIENSVIMTNYILYGYYANSNWISGLFIEGPENDTVENYITRKNWNDWQIFYSNINNRPMDRNNLNNPIPDYLIYVPRDFHLNYLKILSDPNNPKIPPSFEAIYKSQRGTVVYKIHHEN
ncbi:glycosyltransferase family 39 protein [Candidatus Pacearchaeota archaeon]|nr:glycosyltransferase family 39 protein [Candidatus Pacearchaeota archaeon]